MPIGKKPKESVPGRQTSEHARPRTGPEEAVRQRIIADLKALGYAVDRSDQLYHVYSRQAFIWLYDERARLMGEHLYEDKTSLRIEEVDASEAITPARVREIHREQLGKLEAERGPDFWVYRRT